MIKLIKFKGTTVKPTHEPISRRKVQRFEQLEPDQRRWLEKELNFSASTSRDNLDKAVIFHITSFGWDVTSNRITTWKVLEIENLLLILSLAAIQELNLKIKISDADIENLSKILVGDQDNLWNLIENNEWLKYLLEIEGVDLFMNRIRKLDGVTIAPTSDRDVNKTSISHTSIEKLGQYSPDIISTIQNSQLTELWNLNMAEGTNIWQSDINYQELIYLLGIEGFSSFVTHVRKSTTIEQVLWEAPSLNRHRQMIEIEEYYIRGRTPIEAVGPPCPDCGSRNTVVSTPFLRSRDEPATELISCLDCSRGK